MAVAETEEIPDHSPNSGPGGNGGTGGTGETGGSDGPGGAFGADGIDHIDHPVRSRVGPDADLVARAKWFMTRIFPPLAIYIFFTVGFVGHFDDGMRAMMLELTPWVLLGMGIYVLVPTVRERNWQVLVWCAVTYVITFALEAIGVATGAVFGAYDYGPTLGQHLFAVPLVIGFNWVLVILGAVKIAEVFHPNRYVQAVAAGALALTFDIALEPVAIHFDYWTWAAVAVPLQNYVAWFLIATAMALSYTYLRRPTENRWLIHYLIVQFLFFIFLGLAVI